MSTDEPSALYGEINFHINARSAADAINHVLNAGFNKFYSSRQPIDEDRVNQLYRESVGGDYGSYPAACDPRISTWEEGGGSWSACVGRISYPDSQGHEKHAEYGVASLKLISLRPWTQPDCTDDVEHWHAVTRMLDEQAALTQSLDPVPLGQPVRSPRL